MVRISGRMGEVFVWDPFGEQSDCWDPLQGCEDWEHALLVAKWLGAARLLRDSSNQQYFDEEAQELTAPLLHAAALSGEHTILDVYRWVRQRERDTPNAILASAEADDALLRLQAVYEYTERQRAGSSGPPRSS